MEEIEKLRKAVESGKVKHDQTYRIGLGNGEVIEMTGAEIFETLKAMICFFDAEKRGDFDAMKEAHKRLMSYINCARIYILRKSKSKKL